jgi:hypothetical protein
MTLGELIEKLRAAQQRMSRKNAHRLLLMQCEDALIQLATRAGEPSVEKDHALADENALGRQAQP